MSGSVCFDHSNRPPQAVVDYSEEWTEEDMRDLTIYSLRYAARSFGEEEEEEDAEGR